MNTSTPEQPPQKVAPRQNAFLGPLIVLSVALLSIVLSSSDSLRFGLGYTAAKFLISTAFALPIFIVVKYASSFGRRLTMVSALNLLCYLVVACWIIQLLLGVLVPQFMERQQQDATEAARYGLTIDEYRRRLERANVVCKRYTYVNIDCLERVLEGQPPE